MNGRNPGTSSAHKFKNFNEFYTFSHWNITAAMFMTFVTEIIALLLFSLEPLSVVCLGYFEAFATYGYLTFHELIFINVLCLILMQYGFWNVIQRQIMIMMLHLPIAVFLGTLILHRAFMSCFPDIHWTRAYSSDEIYWFDANYIMDKIPCTKDIKNCSRNYIMVLMKPLFISLAVGIFHATMYGAFAWKKKHPAPSSPSSDTTTGGPSPGASDRPVFQPSGPSAVAGPSHERRVQFRGI